MGMAVWLFIHSPFHLFCRVCCNGRPPHTKAPCPPPMRGTVRPVGKASGIRNQGSGLTLGVGEGNQGTGHPLGGLRGSEGSEVRKGQI